MKSLQLGLIVIIAVAALLASALWVMAQAAPPAQEPPVEQAATDEPPVEASAVQAVGIVVTATVGTQPGVCADTTTAFVRANTTVYYCFKLQHTGVPGDAPLTFHNIQMSRGAVNRDLSGIPPLIPGNPRPSPTNVTQFMGSAGLEYFVDSTSVDVTNFITWTARTDGSSQNYIATARARIDIVTPQISVSKTVGQVRTSCAAGSTLRVPSGQAVAFCITIQNTSDITFTNHLVTDAPAGINTTVNYTLAPGASLQIYPSNMQSLGITNGSLDRTAPFTNSVSVTSRTRNNELTATGASTATVGVGNTTVRFTKTVSLEPESCNGSNTIQVRPGTMVYYCVSIENTGVVTLTQHQLVEQYLSIDVRFDYTLRPGERVNITNDFLARHGQPIVFGPFEVHSKYGANNVIGNDMTYSGSSPDGFSVSGTARTTATFPPTPTVAPTSRPDPTSTSTPPFTSTPTNTPIPLTPTPTLTETPTPVTPSPTPTRSYAISRLETPTPRSQVAGIPNAPPQQDPSQQDPSQQQPGQQVPPFDSSLATPTPPIQQFPGQDPVLATATQIAVDATSTAIIAEATASQLAIESAAATALAETQATLPVSPLATPTVDPAVAQVGEPTTMPTETPTATETLPVDTAVPGGDVTVLPPEVTAVVATESPAVVVLVVTNTPEVGAILPEGQRPIVPPTPTTTPDFVMAAARTFDIAVTTMGWLWFLVGSLIFFVTAGVMAGLFFRQSEANRFELPEPDYWLEEEPQADRRRPSPKTGQREEDEWPADLP